MDPKVYLWSLRAPPKRKHASARYLIAPSEFIRHASRQRQTLPSGLPRGATHVNTKGPTRPPGYPPTSQRRVERTVLARSRRTVIVTIGREGRSRRRHDHVTWLLRAHVVGRGRRRPRSTRNKNLCGPHGLEQPRRRPNILRLCGNPNDLTATNTTSATITTSSNDTTSSNNSAPSHLLVETARRTASARTNNTRKHGGRARCNVRRSRAEARGQALTQSQPHQRTSHSHRPQPPTPTRKPNNATRTHPPCTKSNAAGILRKRSA